MANYELVGETGDWEWNADFANEGVHAMSGLEDITRLGMSPNTSLVPFRCWIPR